ncbi:XapX domain-containing protein [Halorussus sp. AFM4]|uniref:XapX domain-containing protein n=1 Tax=Halorussus sp. AFM4 TaxID=3421651 RepID=UPI003EBE553E
MDLTLTLLALLTGFVTGALFTFLGVPLPAPPQLPGIVGIVGIYVVYRTVEYLDAGVDLLSILGLAG